MRAWKTMLTEVVHRIASHPWVYDMMQKLAGRDRNYQRLAPYLAHAAGKTLLDLGAGTGECARLAPPSATYIWLDKDPEKLRGFHDKSLGGLALLGEAGCIGLKDKSVDVALCQCVSHHLTNSELHNTFREVARVCRTRFIFLDAINMPSSTISNLLWKYDRGSYPRAVADLRSVIAQYFQVEHEEQYSIYHHYWLCTGRPKEQV
jgi:ubiquinone/menaquinone biosynthesis C-methylase UbiE